MLILPLLHSDKNTALRGQPCHTADPSGLQPQGRGIQAEFCAQVCWSRWALIDPGHWHRLPIASDFDVRKFNQKTCKSFRRNTSTL